MGAPPLYNCSRFFKFSVSGQVFRHGESRDALREKHVPAFSTAASASAATSLLRRIPNLPHAQGPQERTLSLFTKMALARFHYHSHGVHHHHHRRSPRPPLTTTEEQVLRALYPGVKDEMLPTLKWAIIKLQANYRGVSSRRNPLPHTSSWGVLFGKLDVLKRRQRGCLSFTYYLLFLCLFYSVIYLQRDIKGAFEVADALQQGLDGWDDSCWGRGSKPFPTSTTRLDQSCK